MFQDAALQTEQAEQAITFIVAIKNGAIAALVAFTILYGTAYRRVGSDDFVFLDWLYSNRNRWVNLFVTLTLFSTLSLVVPDVSVVSNMIGFNLNAKVPLSFGAHFELESQAVLRRIIAAFKYTKYLAQGNLATLLRRIC